MVALVVMLLVNLGCLLWDQLGSDDRYSLDTFALSIALNFVVVRYVAQLPLTEPKDSRSESRLWGSPQRQSEYADDIDEPAAEEDDEAPSTDMHKKPPSLHSLPFDGSNPKSTYPFLNPSHATGSSKQISSGENLTAPHQKGWALRNAPRLHNVVRMTSSASAANSVHAEFDSASSLTRDDDASTSALSTPRIGATLPPLFNLNDQVRMSGESGSSRRDYRHQSSRRSSGIEGSAMDEVVGINGTGAEAGNRETFVMADTSVGRLKRAATQPTPASVPSSSDTTTTTPCRKLRPAPVPAMAEAEKTVSSPTIRFADMRARANTTTGALPTHLKISSPLSILAEDDERVLKRTASTNATDGHRRAQETINRARKLQLARQVSLKNDNKI